MVYGREDRREERRTKELIGIGRGGRRGWQRERRPVKENLGICRTER